MSFIYIPEGYKPVLDLQQTEIAIKQIKDFFQLNLATELRLRRVTAPIFVEKGTGLNDDLNGVEKPVEFNLTKHQIGVEVVQSLAKWKRYTLGMLNIPPGFGIYTDMNAIRPDEVVSNLHSIYVDQWDWERVITKAERNLNFLKYIVRKIYSVLKRVEFYIYELYPEITPILPEEITFIHSEDLRALYPDISPKERENLIAEKYGAVFIIGIGSPLSDGHPHDLRAPDYDDWSTPNEDGYKGLNGDIILWNPVLKQAFEISSMGIRVDKQALEYQLKVQNKEDRKKLMFHQMLLNDELPLSIGGGIGQSRICMFFLRKAHIGEVQASVWPPEVKEICQKAGIPLL